MQDSEIDFKVQEKWYKKYPILGRSFLLLLLFLPMFLIFVFLILAVPYCMWKVFIGGMLLSIALDIYYDIRKSWDI